MVLSRTKGIKRRNLANLRGFLTVLLLRADLHADKILLFLRCQERQKCVQNNGNQSRENNVTLTVLIRLNAAAFIKLLAFPMRRLYKSSDKFEISFFAITDNSYCKSFVNIM